MKPAVEEKQPKTQSEVATKSGTLAPSPAAGKLTPKSQVEPGLQGPLIEPKGAGGKDDYLGLGEEVDPSKLLR